MSSSTCLRRQAGATQAQRSAARPGHVHVHDPGTCSPPRSLALRTNTGQTRPTPSQVSIRPAQHDHDHDTSTSTHRTRRDGTNSLILLWYEMIPNPNETRNPKLNNNVQHPNRICTASKVKRKKIGSRQQGAQRGVIGWTDGLHGDTVYNDMYGEIQ
ncbi:hypothetical protein FA95DRAFT_532448 [Auriscalpium vulgare]|uniref:Uncharacterized protein n=1 Tax=Auriscalpium vulgare TaxID=40419 RepID=A0ACB8RGP7_9AGAM|nr:hypothetical protein FA95DRAFT_532448 [Auriscalpium vulgare]